MLSARSAGQVLRHSVGANGIGLGGAYGAIVKDPSALYWNPAGLAHINGETRIEKRMDLSKEAEQAFDEKFEEFMSDDEAGKKKPAQQEKKESPQPTTETVRSFEMQVFASASLLSLDRNLGFSAVAFTAPGGTYAVGLLGAQVKGIDGYDSLGNSTGEKKFQSTTGYIGYAREMGSSRIGLSVNGIYENIGGNTLNGGGLNVGAQVTPFPLIDLGIDVQNLVGAIQNQAVPNSSYDKLDTILRFSLGISTPPPSSSMRLLLGFRTNLDDREKEGFTINIGLAIALTRSIYIMGGFENGNFGGGIGALFFNRLKFAYALNRDPLGIGFQHTLELNLRI
ncbi:MAG: hypothetical protein D6767_04290 [Candidatus Hydrogenedentota bacterium]|nr:MAG: hypothetical protein D6767_04290 [Candidatus Hydrogenedentota bacterium]